MKTLGQIAILAYENAIYDVGLSRAENDLRHWEAAAQAVREAVIEECEDYLYSLKGIIDGAQYCSEELTEYRLKDKK